jgi:Mu transposase-like protein
VQTRRVANDALVTIGAARYSVPVEYVGQTVSVHEDIEHFELFHQERLVARHQKAARYSVVMEPAHYAGLLRAGGNKTVGTPPPRFDPYFGELGEVMVRDLKLYEIVSRSEGGAGR